jgi:O-antigen chain-terminating methyltransferase
MSHPEPYGPGSRDGDPGQVRTLAESSLEELMRRIRLELTGSEEDVLQKARIVGAAAPARSEAAELPSEAAVLSLDEVIDRIRRELKRRRDGQSDLAMDSATSAVAQHALPRWQSTVSPLPPQPMYVLADMLRPSDGEFVDNAFHVLLRRSASTEEKAHYLAALRGGTSKVEILGTIRFSDEGMRHGVHIDGLLIPYKLHKWRRIPVLGWFLATGIALFRFPRLYAHLQKLEAASAQESQQVGHALNDLAQAAESRLARMDEQLGQLEAAMMARLESVQALLSGQAAEQVGQLEAAMMARLESVQALLSGQAAEQMGQLEAAMMGRIESAQADQAAVHAHLASRLDTALSQVAKTTEDSGEMRRAVREIERQLMVLFDRMSMQVGGAPVGPALGPGEYQSSAEPLAAHYVSFEDTFRGTRNDIKMRAAHYLTVFRDAGINAGDGLILDIGCGRGEWLEVLSENGYASRGVDSNSAMVGDALALGLDVVEQDAVAYLRGLDNESVSAVTSMHLVEHLPYEVLVRLLDEALRVLRPGGVLILETPNPENLMVGSYWFYMDPTHRNPIPPPLLQWVVEARGFEGVAIDRLSQNRGVFDIQPVGEDVAGASQINKIVGLLTAAPDYAVVARKPGPKVVREQGT